MAAKRALRAVEPGEFVATPTTIEEAARIGDGLSELRLTRVAIARALDDPNVPRRDMASLSKRLMEIGREITVLEARAKEATERASAVTDESFDQAAI